MSWDVLVVPHDPDWGRQYQEERLRIETALGPSVRKLHHIGSTAILSIHAKPIIDMLAEVDSLAALDAQSESLRVLGYDVKGEYGIPGRRYFRKNDERGRRSHHLHAYAGGSPHIERHLLFRDYLIAHPQHAEDYSELKQDLARRYEGNSEAYMDGKDGFVKEMERLALLWGRETLRS